MQTIEAYYDGRAFVPITPVAARINGRAVVMVFDDMMDSRSKKDDKAYLTYAGALSDESYDQIAEILKDTRQVDANEW